MARAPRPWFILIAGVNGSGKSTFARKETLANLLGESDADAIEVINPDVETQRIRAQNPSMSIDEANVAAANHCEEMVRDRIRSKKGHFAIETVLSTDKYKRIVNDAIRVGWRFVFVYIVIDSVEESIKRVAFRVANGGHDVPEDRLRKRWGLSRAKVPWFWDAAGSAFMFRNPPDFGPPKQVAHKHRGFFIADWPPHPTVGELLPDIARSPGAGRPPSD
jgi:predicted ABC-type ATPase